MFYNQSALPFQQRNQYVDKTVRKLPLNPVSDELRSSILVVLNKKRKQQGNTNFLEIKPGEKRGEIVYVAEGANIPCMICEDEKFFYFKWPSGGCHTAEKGEFLEEVASKTR